MTIELSYETTIADYEAVATNFTIVELIQGDIIVTPPPTIKHQRIVVKLTSILVEQTKGKGEIFVSPIGARTDHNEVFEPDLIYISQENSKIIGENYIAGPPELVIEILSPSTAHRDRNIKMSKYFEFGILEYWIIDPLTEILEVYTRGENEFNSKANYDLKQKISFTNVIGEILLDLNLG